MMSTPHTNRGTLCIASAGIDEANGMLSSPILH